jgi:hypothetical protein
MDDAYTEMKDLPALSGSINAVVSNSHKLRRPPSLSESFAWEPENVSRAMKSNLSGTSINLLVTQESPQSEQTTPPQIAQTQTQTQTQPLWVQYEEPVLNTVMRFVFHITLISIFESVFFFVYVSQLEDNGITHTVGGFVDGVVSSCVNLTQPDQAVFNALLGLFLNPAQVIQEGDAAEQQRSQLNTALFNKSWIYVGSLGGLFVLLTIYARFRTLVIHWKHLVLENVGLVILLAAYEYMFFSTIIFPYNPITAEEIVRNTVFRLNSSCDFPLDR